MYIFRVLSVIAVVLATAWPVCAQISESDAESLKLLEQEFESEQAAYLDMLREAMPAAYRERLEKLSVAQFEQVAMTMRHWEFYTANGPTPMGDYRYQKDGRFREQFLKPMDAVAELLLIDPAEIRDREIAKARKSVIQLGEKLAKARRVLKVNIDPTVGVKSPTGIAYPKLTQPQSCLDRFALYESAVVLAYSVSPPEARPLLLQNAKLCAEVDYEEAQFAMYANQVRMLSGTVAWTIDPLLAACSRDHSTDRKAGRAKGHSSSVPGKETLGKRAKRFGAPVGSEGAGYGNGGIKTIYGFSYNGAGHAMPLYSTRMNIVGPGQREGKFTAMYAKDKSLLHECRATTDELFMLPGTTARDMTTSELRSVYKAMKSRRFADAYEILDKAREGRGFDRALHRYFQARLDAEMAWAINGITRTLAAGDAYAASMRLKDAQETLGGIGKFDRKLDSLIKKFENEKVKEEVKVGKIYYTICERELTAKNLNELMDRYPQSLYAKAAESLLEMGVSKIKFGYEPLLFFTLRDPELNEWGYLLPVAK